MPTVDPAAARRTGGAGEGARSEASGVAPALRLGQPLPASALPRMLVSFVAVLAVIAAALAVAKFASR
jgi:hypothetical protein